MKIMGGLQQGDVCRAQNRCEEDIPNLGQDTATVAAAPSRVVAHQPSAVSRDALASIEITATTHFLNTGRLTYIHTHTHRFQHHEIWRGVSCVFFRLQRLGSGEPAYQAKGSDDLITGSSDVI